MSSLPQFFLSLVSDTLNLVSLKKFTSLVIIIIVSLFLYKITPPAIDHTILPKSSNHPTPPQVTIGLVGDLGLGRFITYTARLKDDFSYSFSAISPWLSQNDFNLANLESPIVDNCPSVSGNTFKFCGDPKFMPSLLQNKFILNLANNHILNYGQSGLDQTQKLLDDSSIKYFYSHNSQTEFLKYFQNGINFGFIGFDLTGTHSYNLQSITDLVSQYDSQVDWLVVSLHWGAEYLDKPEAWKVDFAHHLVDAGADIIHGHHPHVYQEYELYKGKPIFYSLGNFIFDQNWSVPTSSSIIIRLSLDKNTIKHIQKFPIQIKHNSQPNLVN